MEALTQASVAAFEAAEQEELNSPDALQFAWSSSHPLYFNHGGLGGPTAAVTRLRRRAETLAEQQPMAWHRDIMPALMWRAKQATCQLLGVADEQRLQLVSSVSTGLFAVLQSVALNAGDVVITTDTRCAYVHTEYCFSRPDGYCAKVPLSR